ncbi:MAG: hypothetical protein GYA24_13530 [Candidatus Lokiarchaeota archaeon]|nr:hypothetical protein [Candidatus Lokiarchaeota archaeon]
MEQDKTFMEEDEAIKDDVPSPDFDDDDQGDVEPSRSEYLAGILERALDPAVIDGILKAFGMRKAKRVARVEHIKADARFRVEKIEDFHYILCPVPCFYDAARKMECGFAIDVDQDHFDVLPYMHDRGTGAYRVFGELPHCVHMALNVHGTDYTRVSDNLKESVNENSAIYFINHLLSDLAMGDDAPFDIFESKLYLQLINRLVETGDPCWCNEKLVEQKLAQLVAQIEGLDPADPFYENNLTRVGVYLSQFLFGYEDSMEARGFASLVSKDVIKKHAAAMYKGMLSKEFLRRAIEREDFLRDALDLLDKSGVDPPGTVVQDAMAFLLSREWLESCGDDGDFYSARCLIDAFEIQPRNDVIEAAYREYVDAGNLNWLHGLHAWLKIPPPASVIDGWHALLRARYSKFEADEWWEEMMRGSSLAGRNASE